MRYRINLCDSTFIECNDFKKAIDEDLQSPVLIIDPPTCFAGATECNKTKYTINWSSVVSIKDLEE